MLNKNMISIFRIRYRTTSLFVCLLTFYSQGRVVIDMYGLADVYI